MAQYLIFQYSCSYHIVSGKRMAWRKGNFYLSNFHPSQLSSYLPLVLYCLWHPVLSSHPFPSMEWTGTCWWVIAKITFLSSVYTNCNSNIRYVFGVALIQLLMVKWRSTCSTYGRTLHRVPCYECPPNNTSYTYTVCDNVCKLNTYWSEQQRALLHPPLRITCVCINSLVKNEESVKSWRWRRQSI